MQKTLSRYQEENKRLKLAKVDQVKEKHNLDYNSNNNNKEKENESKAAVVSAKLWSKKIKIEAKEADSKVDINTLQTAIKNKFNNKKILLEKNIENYNQDIKLPDINKNQKNLWLNKKNSNSNNIDNTNINIYENNDDSKLNNKEKENNEAKVYNYNRNNTSRNQLSSKNKKESKEEYRRNVDFVISNDNDDGNENNVLLEKKIKSRNKILRKDQEKIDVDSDTSSNMHNLEAENDDNINDISNMMKKILSDEHQVI